MSKKVKKQIEPEYFPLLTKEGKIVITIKEKVDLFFEEYFLPPLEVDLSDIEDYRYSSLLSTKKEASLEKL